MSLADSDDLDMDRLTPDQHFVRVFVEYGSDAAHSSTYLNSSANPSPAPLRVTFRVKAQAVKRMSVLFLYVDKLFHTAARPAVRAAAALERQQIKHG